VPFIRFILILPHARRKVETKSWKRTNDIYSWTILLPFSFRIKSNLLRQLPNQNRRVFYFFFGHIDIKQVQIFSKLVLNKAVDFSCNWIFNSAAVVPIKIYASLAKLKLIARLTSNINFLLRLHKVISRYFGTINISLKFQWQ
jgi:hypothetical protein